MTQTLEEEYQKIISTFPNVQCIDNLIYHIQIPLINDVILDINFRKYPKRPKVVLLKKEGETRKIDNFIVSLQKWKKKDAPAIVDLINEIFTFVGMMDNKEVLITQNLITGIIDLCRNQHPREILGLLRMEQGILTEYILPPGAIRSESSGVFFPSRIPLDPSLRATVHSHPSGNPFPSAVDLNDVFQKKDFHFIIAYPYNLNKTKCFDNSGNEMKFKIV